MPWKGYRSMYSKACMQLGEIIHRIVNCNEW